MESIINRLTEIESAAAAIVEHAEAEKGALDKEYEDKRKSFDADLEKKTLARIRVIRDELEKKTDRLLHTQTGDSSQAIDALNREYEERHTEYAEAILRRITKV